MKRRLLLLSAAATLILGSMHPLLPNRTGILPPAIRIGNPHTVTLNQFAKDVAIATNGKLKITVHPNGSLFKVPEIARAVESGQAQMGEILMSVMVNQNPVFGADALPFVATSFDESRSYGKHRNPSPIRAGQARCQIAVCSGLATAGDLCKERIALCSRHERTEVARLQPCKRRISQQVVGAQPLTIQAAELSQALSTGAVDSFMSSGATGVDSKVWETLTHFHPVMPGCRKIW